MSALLSLSEVHVAYGKVEAVRGVSLAVPKGQIVTVIGANGAGKTTLLNAVMGLLPMRGGLTLDGTPLAPIAVEDRVALGLCLVPERRELFADMSVEDNLLLGAYLARDKPARRAGFDQAYALFPRLAERRHQAAGDLSGGERQMLALARALMSRPRVLLLDEPSLGLAPLIVREIFRIILDLRDNGVSVLLIEQNARAALESANYAYVMENGEIAYQGEAKALISDPRVQDAYLGGA
jgi:branched-chain amino acid transport system ATP-binding protein